MANNSDPDLDLHCLLRQDISRFNRTKVKKKKKFLFEDGVMKFGKCDVILIGHLRRKSSSLLKSQEVIKTDEKSWHDKTANSYILPESLMGLPDSRLGKYFSY